MNLTVSSFPAQKTSRNCPQEQAAERPILQGKQDSSGYAASAAYEWPGSSISGTIVTWRFFAYATISRRSASV